jgi:cytochrome b561
MPPKGFSKLQIALHWAVVLVVGAQFVFHDAIVAAWRDWVRDGSVTAGTMAVAHLGGGSLVLILTLWRLWLRRTRGAPPPPVDEPVILTFGARVIQSGLYGLLILVPLTGIAAWGLDVRASAGLHEVLKNILFLLILLHVGGALWGQFGQKNRVMRRMMVAED